MRGLLASAACLALLFAASVPAVSTAAPPPAAPSSTQITFYGHSAFKVVTPAGKVLLIDPWITNDGNKNGEKDLEALQKADLILITHGHGDHVGNAAVIARRTGARLVASPELMKSLVQHSGFPSLQTSDDLTGSFGGEITALDGEVKILFTQAIHGGSMEIAEGGAFPKPLVYAGMPTGFVVSVRNGPRIYHTGDTDIFSDMALLGDIDLMLACIGGKFTMGPERAARAVRLVKPKMVIPQHSGTWQIIQGNSAQFQAELDKLGLGKLMREMKPGETMVWK